MLLWVRVSYAWPSAHHNFVTELRKPWHMVRRWQWEQSDCLDPSPSSCCSHPTTGIQVGPHIPREHTGKEEHGSSSLAPCSLCSAGGGLLGCSGDWSIPHFSAGKDAVCSTFSCPFCRELPLFCLWSRHHPLFLNSFVTQDMIRRMIERIFYKKYVAIDYWFAAQEWKSL